MIVDGGRIVLVYPENTMFGTYIVGVTYVARVWLETHG